MTSPAEPSRQLVSSSSMTACGRPCRRRGDRRQPDDPLRGLYISDDQALMLAGDSARRSPTRRCRRRSSASGSTRSTRLCSRCAPRPSCTRATGGCTRYLQDDVTRRLPARAWSRACSRGDGVDAPRRARAASPPTRRLLRAAARSGCSSPTRRSRSPTARSRSPTGWRRSCSARGPGCSRPGRRRAAARAAAAGHHRPRRRRRRGRARRCSPRRTSRSWCAGPTRRRSSPPRRARRWS